MTASANQSFRFDANEHCYLIEGRPLPHVTGMLVETGWVDPRWYTDASRERGSAVHRLCTDYDLGALTDLEGCVSPYKGWLQAHAAAMSILRPDWQHIEEPMCNGVFGGRPDRIGMLQGVMTVLEIKSGGEEKAHPLQTALQAVLAAPEVGMPAETLYRGALYVSGDGKFKLLLHQNNRRDFAEARKVIAHCCGGR